MKGLLALGLFLSTIVVVSPTTANAEPDDKLVSEIIDQLSAEELDMVLAHLDSADHDEKKKKTEEIPWYIKMIFKVVSRGRI